MRFFLLSSVALCALSTSFTAARAQDAQADTGPVEVAKYCAIAKEPRTLLSSAILRLGLSARAYHRVLKVARTCADLSGAPDIRTIDVAEAVRLRALDRPG